MRPLLFAAAMTLCLPTSALAGFRVSSTKSDSGRQDRWGASSAIDGDLKTCWQVDPESEQKGEWIEIDVPKSEIDKLSLAVGWNVDKNNYTDYARIKTVRVEIYTDDGEKKVLEHSANLEDKMGMQEIDLPNTAVGSEMSGGKVRIVVTDFYPGQDYPNLAVSEVLVHLKEMDASTTFTSPPPAIEKHDSMAMLDESTRTFWASPPGGKDAEFTLEASGFGISSLGVLPGPSTFSRPKKIEVQVANTTRVYELQNKASMQYFMLPAVVGYTGSAWGEVKVKVLESFPGSSSDSVGIAEIKLKATNYDGF
jgi:hypothetical protein